MARTRQKAQNDYLAQDVVGVLTIALGAILLVGLLSSSEQGIGHVLGKMLRYIAGRGAYAAPVVLTAVGVILLVNKQFTGAVRRTVGFGLLYMVLVTWCQFVRTPSITGWRNYDSELGMSLVQGGGFLGFGLGYFLEWAFGKISAHIVLAALAAISLLAITSIPLASIVGAVLGPVARAFRGRPREASTQRGRIRPLDEKTEERQPVMSIIKSRLMQPETTAPTRPESARVYSQESLFTGGGIETRHVSDADYKLPPVTLLKEPAPQPKRAQAELSYKVDKIEQTLEEFNIQADVVEVCHGPTVTRYEIQLAPGIKVSKIVNLADNLAMSLAAEAVRVEAPIPGKSAIGVEVPNDIRAVVTLREVIESEEFWKAGSKLTFALGKDVAGEPRYADLTKMPHMLVAGATNAGKTVCLNALIASLLFRATPREVKFVLIDPKRVELTMYDGIPHLCAPVVKDVRQATGILRAALKEMERRYDLFVKAGAQKFEVYNSKVKPEERLPYIVIIIDELADLMMQAGPEVEFSICRLAQLARATGIHLIIATQRPSVDVVTGTIKANISSRLSFAVNSQIDSRTILDMGGAERLIGRGDMLFKPIDAGKPTRIQGCFVTDKEIEALTTFLKEQEKPDYTMQPVFAGDQAGGGGSDDTLLDEMYEPAVRLVVTSGYASTSMLQRRFKIGYTRAARLVDAMEQQGIVGPLDGAKPREVLVSKEDLESLFNSGGVIVPEDEDDEEE